MHQYQSESRAGFRLQPSFNFDMYRQSLLLNENPISGKPPYYEVIDDPVSPYFDGSDKDAGGNGSTLLNCVLISTR